MIDPNEQEVIMMSESDWNEMSSDLDYYVALTEILAGIIEDAGIEVEIKEEDVWSFIKENSN